MKEPESRHGSMTLLSRALDLLIAFAETGEKAPRDLLQDLGESRTSLHRYLKLLVEQNLLERQPTRRYRLGLRVLEISRALRAETDWVDLARPVLRRLAADIDETVLLTAVQDGQVICLARVGGRPGLAISYHKGGRFPLHAGAPSKVLLAYQAPEVVEEICARPLRAYTADTITDPRALRAEVAGIRAEGVALSFGELDRGVCGVGAPIFDPYGEVVAAITVAAPVTRVGKENVQPVVVAVQSAAEMISCFIC